MTDPIITPRESYAFAVWRKGKPMPHQREQSLAAARERAGREATKRPGSTFVIFQEIERIKVLAEGTPSPSLQTHSLPRRARNWIDRYLMRGGQLGLERVETVNGDGVHAPLRRLKLEPDLSDDSVHELVSELDDEALYAAVWQAVALYEREHSNPPVAPRQAGEPGGCIPPVAARLDTPGEAE